MVFLTVIPALGQTGNTNFSTAANLVLVNTTVLDDKSRFVTGLRPRDFVLRVDRKAIPVATVSLENEPVSAALVVDASRSMKSVLTTAKEAFGLFLRQAWSGDEYGLIICQNKGHALVPLTLDVSKILEHFTPLTATGPTPLYDSLEKAVALVRLGHNPKKVVVVLTDGEDTSSRLPLLALRGLLEEADIHLYVIQLWAGSASDDRLALRDAAEDTGGIFFSDVRPKRLAEVMSKLDVHWQYVIAFEPPETKQGTAHAIQIRLVKGPNATKFQILCRHSYVDQLAVR
jgi:VWFA-related protein